MLMVNYLVCIETEDQGLFNTFVGMTDQGKFGLFEILYNLMKMKSSCDYFKDSGSDFSYEDMYHDEIMIYKISDKSYKKLNKFIENHEEEMNEAIDDIKYTPETNYSNFYYYYYVNGNENKFEKKLAKKMDKIIDKSTQII